MGLALTLMLLMLSALLSIAQAEAETQAGDVKEKAKAAGSAAKAKAKAQTSHVNVTTGGSGQTKVTVNGQEVKDAQLAAQADSSPVGKSVEVANNQATIQISGCEADAGATPSLTIGGSGNGDTPVIVSGNDISFDANQIVITGEVQKISDLTDPKVTDASGITCGGGSATGSGTDDASTSKGQANANGTAVVELTCEQLIKIDEGGAANGQYGGATGQYADHADLIAELRQKCEGKASADVIAGSIPGGTLADTGGPSFGLLMASLLLVGGGLLLRATLRR